jgi:hypothetical protein
MNNLAIQILQRFFKISRLHVILLKESDSCRFCRLRPGQSHPRHARYTQEKTGGQCSEYLLFYPHSFYKWIFIAAVRLLSDEQADYNDYNLNHFSQLFCSSSLL